MVNCLLGKELDDNKILEINSTKDAYYLCFLNYAEINSIGIKFNINQNIINECLEVRSTKFESHDGFDFILLKIPNLNNIEEHNKKIGIYYRKNLLIFISNNSNLKNIMDEINRINYQNFTLSKILYLFFDRLTKDDTLNLENIEEEISSLEESLITDKKKNYLKEIIFLRKKLLRLKRYYEQFINLLENIDENENNLIDKKSQKYFKIIYNRIGRLYQNVVNLRDYVTQVREAYQAQVDIEQNNIMKIFTVITAIFLPLSLIVGWYGMNLKMPEYNWTYGYPAVIILSFAVIMLCIYLFKRKKWL